MNRTAGRSGIPLATGTEGEAAEHRTVGRVMSILELVLASESQGMRLGQLADALGAPKSSVHGLAKGLVAIGYFREADGRYFAGPAIPSLLATGTRQSHPVDRHVLEHLSAQWEATAVLATLVGDSLVYLDSVEPEGQLIRVIPQRNHRLPLWPRTAGKIFVAYMPPKRQSAYLKRHFSTEAEIATIAAELEQIRETRIAINVGQTVAHHIGVGSPILTASGTATIAIAVIGPRARMEERAQEIAESVRDTADSLSSPLAV